MSPSMLGELDVIARLGGALGGRGGVGGIGDDGVQLRASDGRVVVVDAVVEGVHFRRDFSSAADIAYKALARNISDCHAMGARPTAWLLSLGLADWSAEFVDGLVAGFVEARRNLAPRLLLVGGDTTSSPCATFASITVFGRAPRGLLTRSNARAGQPIWAAGAFGLASCGLEALRAGRGAEPANAPLVAAHRRPAVPRVDFRVLARCGATAAIDISDGLAIDLNRLASASRVGLRIDSVLPGRDAVLAWCGGDTDAADAHQWTGGDDYALIVCAPASPGPGFTRIGEVVAGESAVYLSEPGQRMRTIAAHGHLHGEHP